MTAIGSLFTGYGGLDMAAGAVFGGRTSWVSDVSPGACSPRLTEFMMGLPAGWITQVPGITRTEALQLAGNGVVPQQAARAISIMLDRAAMWQEVAV